MTHVGLLAFRRTGLGALVLHRIQAGPQCASPGRAAVVCGFTVRDGMRHRPGGRHANVRARGNIPRQARHERAAGAGRATPLGDQAQFPGPGDGLGAVGRAELVHDVADVLLDGVEGDHEFPGDGLVRPARRQQPQHL